MTDNMNPTTDLAAEALRKRYDKWSDSDLIDEYTNLTEGNIPPCTLI